MSSVLEAVTLNAVRDNGDTKSDKSRKAALSSLIKRANALSEKMSSEDLYPEVADALRTVQALSEVSLKMTQQSEQLKTAPRATTEAVEAQKALDHTRRNVDAMLKPMESTMETLEHLLDAALEMEETYKSLQAQMATMNDSLKKERVRLASVAQAINNAAKIA
jgi:hypothetical protein